MEQINKKSILIFLLGALFAALLAFNFYVLFVAQSAATHANNIDAWITKQVTAQK